MQNESESRPQKGGEAGTTRFGMEDGDNTDVPVTGDGAAPEAGEERARKAEEEAEKLGDFA